MLTPELISNILKSQKEITADYIYQKLREVEDTLQAIKSLNKDKELEKNKYNQKIKDIDLKIKSVQDKCSHWSSTYNPDPSGNNDSYYSCDICGKEI